MEYAKDVIPVCMECATLDAGTKMCEKCGIEYCMHFSSAIDVRYCGNCMVDVHLGITEITKETRYINPTTKQETSRKRRIATGYEFSGTDWLFAQYHINEIANDEAKFTEWAEYHRSQYTTLMSIREDKRIEKLAKLNQVKINLSPLSGTATPSGSRSRTRVDKVISKPVTDPNVIRATVGAALQAVYGRKPTDAEIDAVLNATKK